MTEVVLTRGVDMMKRSKQRSYLEGVQLLLQGQHRSVHLPEELTTPQDPAGHLTETETQTMGL